jgi:AhpD family alkylhydroperoxidase
MKKNYNEFLGEISTSLAIMGKEMPDVMKGFGMLMQGATKDGALSKKHKELIALALGVAAHCEGCIAHHTHSLVELGTTRAELLETASKNLDNSQRFPLIISSERKKLLFFVDFFHH